MIGRRYTDKSKSEAVRQVIERGQSAVHVALRLGINKHSLYERKPRRFSSVYHFFAGPTSISACSDTRSSCSSKQAEHRYL